MITGEKIVLLQLPALSFILIVNIVFSAMFSLPSKNIVGKVAVSVPVIANVVLGGDSGFI